MGPKVPLYRTPSSRRDCKLLARQHSLPGTIPPPICSPQHGVSSGSSSGRCRRTRHYQSWHSDYSSCDLVSVIPPRHILIVTRWRGPCFSTCWWARCYRTSHHRSCKVLWRSVEPKMRRCSIRRSLHPQPQAAVSNYSWSLSPRSLSSYLLPGNRSWTGPYSWVAWWPTDQWVAQLAPIRPQ